MKFYAYKGTAELGKEPLGTSGKMLFELKTVNGAIRRAVRLYGRSCTIYTYTNFYRDSTFRLVYTNY